MNSKKSKKSDPHRLLLNITDKINLKRSEVINMLLSNQILIKFMSAKYPYEGNCQFLTNKQETPGLKTSDPTLNEEVQLSDESCSVSDVKDYFEYIIKKTWKKGC